MRHFAMLLCIALAGCGAQYRALTAEYRDTYAATAEDQLAVNLARMAANPMAIPNQIQLGNSAATVSGTGTLSASPSVAFRGIALTGLGVSGGSTLSQQMTITPVNNHIELRQLQLLLAHALPDRRDQGYADCASASRDTDDLEDALWRTSFPLSPRARPPGLPLSGTLGPLPDGCLVLVEPRDSCAGNDTRRQVGDQAICFRAGATRRVNGQVQTLSAVELRSLLALWTIAIPLIDDKAMAELAAEYARRRAAQRRPAAPPNATPPAQVPQPPGPVPQVPGAASLRPQQAPISQRRLTPPNIFVVPSVPQ
jgi:hypothetical protein